MHLRVAPVRNIMMPKKKLQALLLMKPEDSCDSSWRKHPFAVPSAHHGLYHDIFEVACHSHVVVW
jgi:hypothetical protein